VTEINNVEIKIYTILIVYLVWCECEIWSLTLQEHRSRMSEKRMLRARSGPRIEQRIGGIIAASATVRSSSWNERHGPCLGL
jgi:hypothetical protein